MVDRPLLLWGRCPLSAPSGAIVRRPGVMGQTMCQVESWRNSNGASVPSSPSSTSTLQPDQGDVVGTVIVRDMVSRSTLVHFRAHTR